MPPEQVVLVSTGSQGEPLSALGRMARGDHHQVTHRAPATPSSSPSRWCPGNETAVYRVINGLARLGATVVHKETARVHVSGHAPAGELLYLLNVAKPRNLMPVHGEWRHLRAHAALAEETGMPRDRVVLAEDGVVVDLVDGKASIVGQRADRQRLRRRARRRRRRRGVAAGAADPRRRGLRRAHRRRRLVDRQDRARRCTCPPAASPTTRRPSTRCCRWSRTTSSGRCRTTRSTRTGCRRSSAGPSASGCRDTYRRRPMIIPTVLEV